MTRSTKTCGRVCNWVNP